VSLFSQSSPADARQENPPPPTPRPEADEDDPRFEASWSKGLHLLSPSEDWDIHLGGRYIGHERIVFDQPDESGYRTRQFFVRLEAEAWKVFSLRISGDFTPIDHHPDARIQELWLRWTPDPAFVLTAGQFKVPNGLDRSMSLLFIEGIERPITSRFQSPEELGLRASGSLEDGLFTWDAAVTSGRNEIVHPPTTGDGEIALDSSTKHFSGKYYLYTALTPWARSPEELLNGIRIGVFASVNFSSGVDLVDGFNIKSPDFDILWLSPAAMENDLFFQGRRVTAGVDPSWTAGPFLARGEFLFRQDHVVRPSTGVETAMETLSWSAVTSCLLTGERKNLGKRVPPRTPVDFDTGGTGAVDVYFRVADAHVDKKALDALGTDFNRYTNRFTSYGVGVNWWPVSNLRFSLELTREDYHQTIVVNDAGDRERSLDGVLMRFQVDF